MGKLISQRYEKLRFSNFHSANIKIKILPVDHEMIETNFVLKLVQQQKLK